MVLRACGSNSNGSCLFLPSILCQRWNMKAHYCPFLPGFFFTHLLWHCRFSSWVSQLYVKVFFPIKPSPSAFFPFFIVLKIIVHFIIGGALNLMNYVIKAQEILAIVIYNHFCSGLCGALDRLPSPAPTWFKCFPDTPRRWPQGWPSATDWQINVCYGLNCSPPSKFIQWSPNPSTSEYDYICSLGL